MQGKISRRKLTLVIVVTGVLLVFISLLNAALQNTYSSDAVFESNEKPVVNGQVEDTIDIEQVETLTTHYNPSLDWRYNYEFRLELHPSSRNGSHRVMLVLYGAKRACDDMWDFTVGRRIMKAIFAYGFSILTICSRKETYDIDFPILKNNDAKYIFFSLQKWLNTVYLPKFKQYPRLYIHATSRGSKFAGILCRVLPIQAQLFYTFPGHREAMLTRSAYSTRMQQRLIHNVSYANWFYFDFCYNAAESNSPQLVYCPFRSLENYFYPLPPTLFTYLEKDPYQNPGYYEYFVRLLSENAEDLGGSLLAHKLSIKWFKLGPADFYPQYMQTHFHPWKTKPYAARWFHEHFTHPGKYKAAHKGRQTCWCIDVDFKYYELMPSITLHWTEEQIEEYSDYVRDIRKHENAFCEEVCGDLMTTHSMVSRDIDRTLKWIDQIDELRRSMNASNV